LKILVTGANGFVGTHLCTRLLDLGHSVYALVRTPSKFFLTHKNLFVIEGNLNSPRLPWIKNLPDDLFVCVHTAGLVHSYVHEEFAAVNIGGTENLVSTLREKYPAKFKFILISSLAAAGPANLGEKRTLEQIDFPVSEYGRSKKSSEEILLALAPKEWLISIIRPPMIIGPGDVAVLDIFKMVKSRLIILPGWNSKNKEYSFVCVLDLVEIISCVVESPKAHRLLYSASPQIIRFSELIDEIKSQMNLTFILYIPIPFFLVKFLSFLLHVLFRLFSHSLRLTPDKLSELAPMSWTCDGSEVTKQLGLNYHYNLRKTVEITLKDYQSRKWI
jgi:nucleoside-diphosphate-sugar epimerase